MKRRRFIKSASGIFIPAIFVPRLIRAAAIVATGPVLFPAAGGAGPWTDNFNRANETPIGTNWTTITSMDGFSLSSNACIPPNVGNDAGSYYNAVTPNANQYSQAKITCPTSGGGGQGPGVAVRIATGAQTLYRCVLDASGSNNIELSKIVAGSYTQIWQRTVTYSAAAVLKVAIVGTTITVTYNGSAVGADATDSSIASGRFGISYSSSDTGSIIDDWQGDNL